MTTPRPGPDEILLTTPNGRHLCNDREHRNAGRLAEVILTFGQLGELGRDAMWPEAWHRSYPMCQECLDTVVPIVGKARPNVVFTGPVST